MSLYEIVLPETTPETEWVGSRPLQKVSPTYTHAVLQRLLAAALGDWADAGRHGRVGTEWRFRITPPNQITRPLVPDIAFLSYAAIPPDADRERIESPLAPPTIAIEILSPTDSPRDVESKIATYLAAGTAAVLIVDPTTRTIAIRDASLRIVRTGELLTHAALPNFALDVEALFTKGLGSP